jgi:predicted porin
MNKCKLAAAVSLSLLMSGVAIAGETTTTAYGTVRLSIENNEGDIDSQDELSRFGLKGSTKLENGMTAVGQFEYGVDFTQGAAPKLRLGFVGLKGEFGEIYHGSQTTLWHKFVRGAYFSDGKDSLRMYTIRDDGLTQYYYKQGGFKLGLGIQTEDKDGNNIDTVQVGGEYKSGGFKGQFALVKDKNTDPSDKADKNEGQVLGVRLWYTAGPVTVSAFTHRASDDFDYKTGSLCVGEKTTTDGIYGAYKTGAHKIHARYAVNECDVKGEKNVFQS